MKKLPFTISVIPHLPTGQAGLMRNPVFPVKTGTKYLIVPRLRGDDVWIPAGVYLVLDTGQE